VLDDDAGYSFRDILEPVHHLFKMIIDFRADDKGHLIGMSVRAKEVP